MDLHYIAVIAGIVGAVLLASLLASRGAGGRLHRELSPLKRVHREVLALLAGRGPLRRIASDGDWERLDMPVEGGELHLDVESLMLTTTFIEYRSRLVLVAQPGFELAALEELPVDQAARMSRHAAGVKQSRGRLTIILRPSKTIERYSYAVRLQLRPDRLEEALEVGAELARHLLRR